jgi:hypothetical protein
MMVGDVITSNFFTMVHYNVSTAINISVNPSQSAIQASYNSICPYREPMAYSSLISGVTSQRFPKKTVPKI